MFKTISDVIIWSEDHRQLAKWYEEKLGLKSFGEVNHPQDQCIGFKIGEVEFWIGYHDQVKGKNKDSLRIMHNLVVDSVSQVYNVLSQKGVKFIAKPFKAPTFDKYFATFEDLDGNILQLIGNK